MKLRTIFIILCLAVSSFCCFGMQRLTDDDHFDIHGFIAIHFEEVDSLTYLDNYYDIVLFDSNEHVVTKQWKLLASSSFIIPDLPAGQYVLRIYPYPEYAFGAVRDVAIELFNNDVDIKIDIFGDCRDLVTDDIREEAKAVRTIYVWDDDNRNGRYTRITREEKQKINKSKRRYKVKYFYLDDALPMTLDMYLALNWATFDMLTDQYGKEWIEYVLPNSMGLKSYVVYISE